jgi:hypothetical protein
MKDLRFPASVRRVVRLTGDATGNVTPEVLFEREQAKPKRGSRALRPLEKLVHRWARAEQARTAKYVERHERSNEKRKDGWVRDLNVNVLRATKAGAKPLRWSRWIRF